MLICQQLSKKMNAEATICHIGDCDFSVSFLSFVVVDDVFCVMCDICVCQRHTFCKQNTFQFTDVRRNPLDGSGSVFCLDCCIKYCLVRLILLSLNIYLFEMILPSSFFWSAVKVLSQTSTSPCVFLIVLLSSYYLLTFMLGYFLTKIFHPNIATNGEICVNALKKDWNPSLGLRHVLMVCSFLLFISPFVLVGSDMPSDGNKSYCFFPL